LTGILLLTGEWKVSSLKATLTSGS